MTLAVGESCAGTMGYGGGGDGEASSSYCSSESGSCSSARELPRVVMNEAGCGRRKGGARRNSLCGVMTVAAPSSSTTPVAVPVTMTATAAAAGTAAVQNGNGGIVGMGRNEEYNMAVSPASNELQRIESRLLKARGHKKRKAKENAVAARSDCDSDGGCRSPSIDSYPSSPSPDFE